MSEPVHMATEGVSNVGFIGSTLYNVKQMVPLCGEWWVERKTRLAYLWEAVTCEACLAKGKSDV